jgi:CBS domain-containing protein
VSGVPGNHRRQFLKGSVRDVMKEATSASPLLVARTDQIVSEAAAVMLTHSLTRLPVLNKCGSAPF